MKIFLHFVFIDNFKYKYGKPIFVDRAMLKKQHTKIAEMSMRLSAYF